jgi:hypothetical protein
MNEARTQNARDVKEYFQADVIVRASLMLARMGSGPA